MGDVIFTQNRSSLGRAPQSDPRNPATMVAFVPISLPLRHHPYAQPALQVNDARLHQCISPRRRKHHGSLHASLITTATAAMPAFTSLPPLTSLPSLTLAATTPLIQAGKLIAGPGINIFNFAMVVRIILSWYPKADLAKAPWIFIAVPTEPLLRATRNVIKPVGGVDISPIVWFAIMSFVHEILVGPQGLLVLLELK